MWARFPTPPGLSTALPVGRSRVPVARGAGRCRAPLHVLAGRPREASPLSPDAPPGLGPLSSQACRPGVGSGSPSQGAERPGTGRGARQSPARHSTVGNSSRPACSAPQLPSRLERMGVRGAGKSQDWGARTFLGKGEKGPRACRTAALPLPGRKVHLASPSPHHVRRETGRLAHSVNPSAVTQLIYLT